MEFILAGGGWHSRIGDWSRRQGIWSDVDGCGINGNSGETRLEHRPSSLLDGILEDFKINIRYI